VAARRRNLEKSRITNDGWPEERYRRRGWVVLPMLGVLSLLTAWKTEAIDELGGEMSAWGFV
jgi:hypothetical protein